MSFEYSIKALGSKNALFQHLHVLYLKTDILLDLDL